MWKMWFILALISCCATASLRNVQIFRAFGLPVVPVVDISGYDYPIKRGLIPRASSKNNDEFHGPAPQVLQFVGHGDHENARDPLGL